MADSHPMTARRTTRAEVERFAYDLYVRANFYEPCWREDADLRRDWRALARYVISLGAQPPARKRRGK